MRGEFIVVLYRDFSILIDLVDSVYPSIVIL